MPPPQSPLLRNAASDPFHLHLFAVKRTAKHTSTHTIACFWHCTVGRIGPPPSRPSAVESVRTETVYGTRQYSGSSSSPSWRGKRSKTIFGLRRLWYRQRTNGDMNNPLRRLTEQASNAVLLLTDHVGRRVVVYYLQYSGFENRLATIIFN